jgi:serine/threonine protein phosphatase PrpC
MIWTCTLHLEVGGTHVRVKAVTDRGLVRRRNEDNFIVAQIKAFGNALLCAVADGMGGHADGDIASGVALAALEQAIKEASSDTTFGEAILLAMYRANREVYASGIARFGNPCMGTTLTAAIISKRSLCIGHVGDSRAYVFHGMTSEIEQVTEDHSVVGALVKTGSLTEKEAMHHPDKHILTRAIGTDSKVSVDIIERTLTFGDVVILCTDGLTGLISNDEIETMLAGRDLETVPAELVALAKDRGGFDNITVIAVGIDSNSNAENR